MTRTIGGNGAFARFRFLLVRHHSNRRISGTMEHLTRGAGRFGIFGIRTWAVDMYRHDCGINVGLGNRREAQSIDTTSKLLRLSVRIERRPTMWNSQNDAKLTDLRSVKRALRTLHTCLASTVPARSVAVELQLHAVFVRGWLRVARA